MTPAEQVAQAMRVLTDKVRDELGIELQLPPPSMATLGTEFIEVDPTCSLKARVPFNPAFANPTGVFQGGFLCAAIDDVFGPLSYMAAQRPVATIELSTSFLKPFTASHPWVQIEAKVESMSKRLMVLRAEVRTPEGDLLALATTHALIQR